MRHSEHSPDAGAVSCKQDTAKLNFKYDLRTRYIVTEMCPDQYGRWTSRSHTSKSPSQLQPAHYQLIVGDKGDPADDQHIRKLTIVDLELVTPAGHGHRLDGLFQQQFDAPSSRERKAKLAELKEDKPLMVAASIAFAVIFLCFLNK